MSMHSLVSVTIPLEKGKTLFHSGVAMGGRLRAGVGLFLALLVIGSATICFQQEERDQTEHLAVHIWGRGHQGSQETMRRRILWGEWGKSCVPRRSGCCGAAVLADKSLQHRGQWICKPGCWSSFSRRVTRGCAHCYDPFSPCTRGAGAPQLCISRR